MRNAGLSSVLVLLAVLSCSRPSYDERFIRSGEADGGVYRFEVDMTDTLLTYDISLYSRFDGSHKKISSLSVIPLEAVWVAPDSLRYAETVVMPLPSDGFSSRYSRDVILPYRSALVPVTPGKWTLELRPLDAPSTLRGLGMICYRNDGTR